MSQLIGLSGRRGSGKDTFLDLLNTELDQKGYFQHYERMSLADPLKDMAAVLTGDEPATFRTQEGKAQYLNLFGMTRGQLLQRLGTDCLRVGLMDDVWIRSLDSRIQASKSLMHAVTDVRFPNEAQYIHNAKGVLIRLEGNPLGLSGDGSRNDQHPSETALDDYADFDIVVLNNGTLEELRLAAMQVAKYLAGGVNHRVCFVINAAERGMFAADKRYIQAPGYTLP